MARGSGSTTGYRGAAGQTRAERIHHSCTCGAVRTVEVYRCVNAATHPELASRLRTDDPAGWINQTRCPRCTSQPIGSPVIYHDPGAERFVLVLSPAARHTELAERIAVLHRLAEDTAVELPHYVRDFKVVFGAADLVAELGRAGASGAAHQQLDAGVRELEARKVALEQAVRAAESRRAQLDGRVAELESRRRQLENRVAEAEARRADLFTSAERPMPAAMPELEPLVALDPGGTPLPRPVAHEDIETDPVELMSAQQILAVERAGRDPRRADKPQPVIASAALRPAAAMRAVDADPAQLAAGTVADGSVTRVGGTHDVELERWIASREPTLKRVEDGRVRLAATVGAQALEGLVVDELAVAVRFHRLPSYPLVVLALGADGAAAPSCFVFDVQAEGDRAVLLSLAREFTIQLNVFDGEYVPVATRVIAAPMADNVRYALSAADEHLRTIPRAERSFVKAELVWSDPAFDRAGARLPERADYRPALFAGLESPARVREALIMVERFSQPELEERVLLVWGEPVPHWHQNRAKTVLKAVELGLWPGPELARMALSTGAARSRKDLLAKLLRGFRRTVSSTENDLDADAIEANWRALAEEQAALGGDPSVVRPGVIEADPRSREVVSGTIGESGPAIRRGRGGSGSAQRPSHAGAPPSDDGANGQEPVVFATLDSPRLVAMLPDESHGRDAALELARRAEPSALPGIFGVLPRMTRAEAVEVLGEIPRYGSAAERYLLEGLDSRKGFLRQGCALALAALRSDAGIEAIADRVVSEPTEIWRELARAMGEAGARAVMPLVARIKRADAVGRERLTWALAHVAARGGSMPIRTVAQGADAAAAAVAAAALEVSEAARADDEAVRGPQAPRDQTVNRAFSRQFFERLNRDAIPARREDSVVVALDEGDLIEDDGEPVDESDLVSG